MGLDSVFCCTHFAKTPCHSNENSRTSQVHKPYSQFEPAKINYVCRKLGLTYSQFILNLYSTTVGRAVIVDKQCLNSKAWSILWTNYLTNVFLVIYRNEDEQYGGDTLTCKCNWLYSSIHVSAQPGQQIDSVAGACPST